MPYSFLTVFTLVLCLFRLAKIKEELRVQTEKREELENRFVLHA